MKKPKAAYARPYLLSVRMHMPAGRAEKIARSLAPEIGRAYEKRSATSMNINKNILSLVIGAEDATALKASFNSYMKLVILCNELAGKEA